MRFSLSSHSRLLIGLLIALLLILGVLIRARQLLLESPEDALSQERPSNTRAGPPRLPGIREPQSMEKEPLRQPPLADHPKDLKAAPIGMESLPSPPIEPMPFRGKARILPPIQAAPDEEEILEFSPEMEPEPIGDEIPEEEPPPPMPPEQSPDFAL
jgi:hypothetical protein